MERRREEGLGTYEARAVLGILNVKPHVLRYWERTLPLIRSRRDESGRRVWTSAQVRMLLRIRHHVVDRRLSPAAAGEAVLREAAGVSADAKARLEALRGRLVALLLHARRASDSDSGSSSTSSGPSSGRKTLLTRDRNRPGERRAVTHDTLPIAPYIERGVITPPASHTVRSALTGPPHPLLEAAPTVETGPLSSEKGATLIRVVVGHLLATGSPKSVAEALKGLITHRLAGVGEGRSLVVPVPPHGVDAYSEAFRDSITDGRVLIVPLPRLEWRGRSWWSPRLALLATLAEDGRLARWLADRGAEALYLWGVDDPASPVAPPVAMVRAARRGASGLAMGLQRRDRTFSAIDMTVIDARRRGEVWNAAAAYGGWSYYDGGRTARTSMLLESDRGESDNSGWRWRYDLWLRDMVRIESALFLVDRPPVASPWRGDRWLEELRWIWRDAFPGA